MLTLPDIEGLLFKFRYPIAVFLLGASLAGLGALISASDISLGKDRVEILTASTEAQDVNFQIIVEIAGEVVKPGVYKLPKDARVEDLLIAAGGISASADRGWMEKSLNRAAKLSDGQKIYIPAAGEQLSTLGAKDFGGSGVGGLININMASQKELESLPGIGPVYAQNIIEHRPYSNIEELLTKGVLKQSTYQKIKDLVAVY